MKIHANMHVYGKCGSVFLWSVQRFVFAIIPLSATLRQADNSREDLQPSRLQRNSGRSAGNTLQRVHTQTHTHTLLTPFTSPLQSCSAALKDAALKHLLFLSRSFASWWPDVRSRCRTDAAFSRLASRF